MITYIDLNKNNILLGFLIHKYNPTGYIDAFYFRKVSKIYSEKSNKNPQIFSASLPY